ncbi:MAG: hypothetical protein ABI477_11005 [Chryseolinea sp.]
MESVGPPWMEGQVANFLNLYILTGGLSGSTDAGFANGKYMFDFHHRLYAGLHFTSMQYIKLNGGTESHKMIVGGSGLLFAYGLKFEIGISINYAVICFQTESISPLLMKH